MSRVLLIAHAYIAACTGYLLALLVAAATPRARQAAWTGLDDGDPLEALRLLAVVPAHDEATGIQATVRALRALDVPVIVVADNCADGTAALARDSGAEVFVRDDPELPGKGEALGWALPRVLAAHPEAVGVLVVDADCTPTPNLAQVARRALASGVRVAQADNVVGNPHESRSSALRFAAFRLINTVRPLGRARLGWSAGLQGTGMVFSRAVLEEHGWTATGLAEDVEQHLLLVAAGERVAFLPEAGVRSDMPLTLAASRAQQARWEGGRRTLVRRHLLRLMRRAVQRRDPAALAAAGELLVPPQSVLLASNLTLGFASLSMRSRAGTRMAAAALTAQATYVVGGLLLTRTPGRVWAALLYAPVLVVFKLGVVARRAPTGWERTEREQGGDAAPPALDRMAAVIRRVQYLLLARPLRPLYSGLRRGFQLGNYALRRPHEEDFAAFSRFAARPGIFLDVGASSGTSAMSFRIFDRHRPILSIEPNAILEPELRFLRRVLRPFDFIICAAGAENHAATLYVPSYRGQPITAESSLDRAAVTASPSLRDWLGDRMESADFRIDEHEVPIRRLDDLDLAPAYVKIDAQGAELSVLDGLTHTLERHRPILLIERGDTFDEVLDFLTVRGYEPHLYRPEAARLEPMEPGAESLNVFFLPSSDMPVTGAGVA